MRFICFLICNSVLLIFGLTGCQPDKLPNNPDLHTPLKITNSEININQLKKIKTIDIKSSFSVDFGQSQTQDNYSQVKSSCWNNFLDNHFNTAIVDNRKPLIIKDILPVEVFTPSSSGPHPELFCDFEISPVRNNEQKGGDSKIFLKEIEITNIENYSNFELPFEKEKNPGKFFYFQKKDIQNIRFTFPIDRGQIFTLCEEKGKVHPFEKQILEMSLLFDEKLFESDNLLLCRFVIRQQIPEIKWITEAFFIQGEEPKITYQYRHNYTGNRTNERNNQKMGLLTLSNESPEEVYLQISRLSTTINIMGVYSSFSQKNINHSSNQLDLNAFWTVENKTPIKKGNEKLPHIYKLETGESMDISLRTQDHFLCNQGEPLTTITQRNQPVSMGIENNFGSKFHDIQENSFETPMEIKTHNCKTLFYLSGFLYHLQGFPKITFNLFQTMEYQKWQSFPLEKVLKPQYNGKFSQWVPNYQFAHQCPGLEIKNELKNYPIQNNTLNSVFQCRLNNHGSNLKNSVYGSGSGF